MGTFHKAMYFIFTLGFAVASVSSSPLKSPSRCGEILTSTFGIISYKPNETYIPNERCVWIIRVENATSFDFTFSHMGYPSEYYNAKIVTFELYTIHRYFPSLGTRNIAGNVAVVTFSTSADANPIHQGFTMTYLAITQPEPIISPASRDYITNYHEGRVSHPSNRELYTNNEINVIIFTPDFVHIPGTTIEINFNTFDLAGDNCTDSVLVSPFTTEHLSSGDWGTGRTGGQIFCNDHGTVGLETYDILMLVFMTQSGSGATGLDLTYNADIQKTGDGLKNQTTNNATFNKRFLEDVLVGRHTSIFCRGFILLFKETGMVLFMKPTETNVKHELVRRFKKFPQ